MLGFAAAGDLGMPLPLTLLLLLLVELSLTMNPPEPASVGEPRLIVQEKTHTKQGEGVGVTIISVLPVVLIG